MNKILKHLLFSLLFCGFATISFSQKGIPNQSELTVEHIMRDAKWIGISPSNVFWSDNSDKVFFDWNPENKEKESLHFVGIKDFEIKENTQQDRSKVADGQGVKNKNSTLRVYQYRGDIYLKNLKNNTVLQITETAERESRPAFIENDNAIVYSKGDNFYKWVINTGQTVQLTDFRTGKKPDKNSDFSGNEQEKSLYNTQMEMFDVLKTRKKNKEKQKQKEEDTESLSPVYTESYHVYSKNISPDSKSVVYQLYKKSKGKKIAKVPNYVTEDGYVKTISTREKVGTMDWKNQLMFYNLETGKTSTLNYENLSGINQLPEYTKDYPDKDYKHLLPRGIIFGMPVWSSDSKKAVLPARSIDNKDRWILCIDTETKEIEEIDHQHDEAWIAGPGIGGYFFPSGILGWLPDNKNVWYQSEQTGYSHLWKANVQTKKKTALTSGDFEIFSPHISKNKKWWYFSSNEVHPGVRHFYRMPIEGGKREQITTMEGNNQVFLSPDEQRLAVLFSSSNSPDELYIMPNKAGAKAQQITQSQSKEFLQYDWRKPEVITFTASDSKDVYARIYEPKADIKNGAAVIFVHGAGYLQNAHKWWSRYFREYMFHNLLADNGYTVLDIDYRGSKGYGRDCRTGIYRHMGGKDLSDQIDGAKYLIEKHGIDTKKIGIYGGSYGGFITLMAMFKHNDTFACGAALRSVTDWAHYNRGYTSNILNTPENDSLAYARSSPIYFADGLDGHLLMLHGMIDLNVHFQDVVRLSQRLIELGKDDWELAVYPLEDHSFKEPSSWTDEYKRIFKLFQTYLVIR